MKYQAIILCFFFFLHNSYAQTSGALEVAITSPSAGASFYESEAINLQASVSGQENLSFSFLHIVSSNADYRSLRLGNNPLSLWSPTIDATNGGVNNLLKITLKDINGDADWSQIRVSISNEVVYGDYIDPGVNTSDWFTITIPLSDFPDADFTQLQNINIIRNWVPGDYAIGLKEVIFTNAGSENDYVYFGKDKTDNALSDDGYFQTSIVEETVEIEKVIFSSGTSLLAEDAMSPYEFLWEQHAAGTYELHAEAVTSDGSFQSDTVNVQIKSGYPPLRIVQIHLDRYNADKGEPGNFFNGIAIQSSAASGNTELRPDLRDQNQQPTGWNFFLVNPSWNSGSIALHTDATAFPYPEFVVRNLITENSFMTNGPAEFYIGNLNPERSYRIACYGYLNVTSEVQTEFKVQDESQILTVTHNINNTVVFDEILPDENNRINISIAKAPGEDHYYTAANVITLEEFGPPGGNQPPIASNIDFSGTLKENESITANFSYSDAEGDQEGMHLYRFIIADDELGTNETIVQESTSANFVLQSSHIDKMLDIEVIPHAQSGTSPGNPLRLGFVGPIQPASIQSPQKVVQIHLDRYNSDEGESGNYFNGVAIQSAVASANTELKTDLLDVNEQQSGWNFFLINPSWNAGTVALHTGVENFPYPEGVVRNITTENSFIDNDPAEFYIGNLNPERRYRITCYGYLDVSFEVRTEFKVQNHRQSLTVSQNIDNTVVFNEALPDENNRIYISIAKAPGEDDFYTAANVIVIEELGPPPAAPQDFMVYSVSDSAIKIEWTDSVNDNASYEIYRDENGDGIAEATFSTEIGVSAFIDSLLVDGQTYSYYMRAVGGDGGVSQFTETLSATLQPTQSKTFYAIANGAWNNPSIWSLSEGGPPANEYPQPWDVAHVSGFNISITENTEISNILISNEQNNSTITVSSGKLTVSGKVRLVKAAGSTNLCKIEVLPPGSLAVRGYSEFPSVPPINEMVGIGTMEIENDFIIE